MSRTIKDKPGYKRKYVKKSLMQKLAHLWADDFYKKRKKDKKISKLIRSRYRKMIIKEIKEQI